MRNAKEVMRVAKEILDSNNQGENNNHEENLLKLAKRKFKIWIMGIVVSFIPLIALPFWNFIDNVHLGEMFYEIFCNVGIMFIAISFTITALSDFTLETVKNEKEGWLAINSVLLILGALLYGVMAIKEKNSTNVQTEVFFWTNLAYFILMFLLSSSKYIKAILEVK